MVSSVDLAKRALVALLKLLAAAYSCVLDVCWFADVEKGAQNYAE